MHEPAKFKSMLFEDQLYLQIVSNKDTYPEHTDNSLNLTIGIKQSSQKIGKTLEQKLQQRTYTDGK